MCDALCDNQPEILSQSCYSHDQKNSSPILLRDFKAFLKIKSEFKTLRMHWAGPGVSKIGIEAAN